MMATESSVAAPPRVDLLRHGRVTGGDRLRGWQDDPLNSAGWRQMASATAGPCRWQRVLSSPLNRCADFAADLAARFDLPLELDPRWRELGFGDWEGRTVDELLARSPDALRRFWDRPRDHPPPGGEPLGNFERRVDSAWADLNRQLGAGERALLVTHGGVIRLLLCRTLGLQVAEQFRFEVPHAALVTLILQPGRPRLYLGQ